MTQVIRYRTVTEAEKVPTTLDGFREWEFTNGGTTGQDFKVFARLFKASIKRALPPGVNLVKFSGSHYDLSGFVQKDGKFAYFSIADVRGFPGEWYEHILVRTAKSDMDYTGGPNGFTTLGGFSEAVNRLLS